MHNVDVILVTYNRIELLKECLTALLAQRDQLSTIFIVNNNSSDGTTEYLESFSTDNTFDIENLDSNIGGAAGFERAAKNSLERGTGEYLWIMDDDTIPNKNSVKELLGAAKSLKSKFGFLCSNVRWVNGKATNIPSASTDWPEKLRLGLVKVESATFVSVFVARNTVLKCGLPLGKMQIWGDDTEYTTRLSHYENSYLVINSVVIHKTKYNLSGDSIFNISEDRIWRYKCMYRNLIYIDKKYYSKKKLVKNILKNIAVAFMCFSSKSFRWRRLFAVIAGTFDGIFFNPKINYVKDESNI